MNDWVIVKSKSGNHKDHGYPLGEILIRDPKDIERSIKESEIHDPIITSYTPMGRKVGGL